MIVSPPFSRCPTTTVDPQYALPDASLTNGAYNDAPPPSLIHIFGTVKIPVNVGDAIGAHNDILLVFVAILVLLVPISVFIVPNVVATSEALYETYEAGILLPLEITDCLPLFNVLTEVVNPLIAVVCDESLVCNADTFVFIVPSCADKPLEISTYDRADVPKFTFATGNL